MAPARIHPEYVGRMAAADDGRDRRGGDRDYFGFGIALFEPVAERGGGQVQRRIATHPGIAVQSGNGRIGDQVHRIVRRKIDPVFGYDAMSVRVGAGRQRGQSGGRVGLHVIVMRVGEIGALIHEPAEAVSREVVLETVHIVCPHLADDDIDHEFGLGTCLGGSASGAQCAEQQDG